MRERVVIASEVEFWEIVAQRGCARHGRFERLRVGQALALLDSLGLDPSWQPDALPIGALVQESKAMKLGPTILSGILGGHYEALKKVFNKPSRCPRFDTAVRWAVIVAERAAERNLDRRDLLLHVRLPVDTGGGTAKRVPDPKVAPERVPEWVPDGATEPLNLAKSPKASDAAPKWVPEWVPGGATAPLDHAISLAAGDAAPQWVPERVPEWVPESATAPNRVPVWVPESATAHEAEDGSGGPNSAKSDPKKVVDTSPLSAQGSSLMAILEWRLGGEMRLRVECRREDVAQRIEAERRAGTKGQIYIDNQLVDDRDMRLADIEERLAVQTELLTKLCKMLDGQSKPDAANPGHEQLAELLRRAEELSADRGFPWAREFMRSFVEANKEEE